MDMPRKNTSGHGAPERGLMEPARATASTQIDRRQFDGRFGRMFPDLHGAVFFNGELESLAAEMGAEKELPQTPETELDSEENFGIPAGYTYFGQFVDHDITLDAVSLSMKQEDLSAVENFRTPALDLYSPYGRGPDDQPYMFDPTGRKFQEGEQALFAGKGGRTTQMATSVSRRNDGAPGERIASHPVKFQTQPAGRPL